MKQLTGAEHARQWLEKVRINADDLRSLIADWHPSARHPAAIRQRSELLSDGGAVAVNDCPDMPITAPNAERACQEVRQLIRKEHPNDPITAFDHALAAGDVGVIMNLLNEAWFGVPESRSCWSIRGFSAAVDLLEDPPDPPEEESHAH